MNMNLNFKYEFDANGKKVRPIQLYLRSSSMSRTLILNMNMNIDFKYEHGAKGKKKDDQRKYLRSSTMLRTLNMNRNMNKNLMLMIKEQGWLAQVRPRQIQVYLKSSSMSRTLARRLLHAFSLRLSSFIWVQFYFNSDHIFLLLSIYLFNLKFN